MKCIIFTLLSFNLCTAITLNDLNSYPECEQFAHYSNLQLSDTSLMQDVLIFAMNNGYTAENNYISKFITNLGYTDFDQYCIEHICSSGIKDLIKLNKIKPQVIKKALYDYKHILLKLYKAEDDNNIITIINKSFTTCIRANGISHNELKSLLAIAFKTKIKRLIYGVSTLESKIEDVVLLA
jgi:hypothetical protein